MAPLIRAFAIILALAASAQPSPPAGRPGAQAGQGHTLQSEMLISTLPASELTKRIASGAPAIEHESEVPRGGPVTVVVRTTGCQQDAAGACHVSADVVAYTPDGSVLHEAKELDLTAGHAIVSLTIGATAATGLYKVVVTVRDVTARRFSRVERPFGVK